MVLGLGADLAEALLLGELFGEGGYFGHGPIMHEKCFEVPFVEGLRP